MVSTSPPDGTKADDSSSESTPELLETKFPPKNRFYSPKTRYLSPEELSEAFQRCITDLEQPERHQALKDTFEHDHRTNITQCICLGLGSFSRIPAYAKRNPVKRRPTRSLHQLAVLKIILRILANKHQIQNLYFQDPIFTDAESDFLQSLGHTVLHDPAASQKMTPSTFLFAPFLAVDVAAATLAVAYPALSVGNGPAGYLNCLKRHGRVPEEMSPEIRAMFGVFGRFESATFAGRLLPRFERQEWMEGTMVRWLCPGFEDGVGEGKEDV